VSVFTVICKPHCTSVCTVIFVCFVQKLTADLKLIEQEKQKVEENERLLKQKVEAGKAR